MSDAAFRALLRAVGHPAATPLPDGPPQADGAPFEALETLIERAREWNASSPRAPYGAMTTGEAEAWRTGWRVAQSAILDRVAPRYPSLAAEIAGMRMPQPMQEPDGLSERGA